jgi:predicted kinase
MSLVDRYFSIYEDDAWKERNFKPLRDSQREKVQDFIARNVAKTKKRLDQINSASDKLSYCPTTSKEARLIKNAKDANFKTSQHNIRQAAKQVTEPKNGIRRFQREELEFILDYLIDEGYTDSYESALVILETMSEEWLECIIEELDNETINEFIMEARKRPAQRASKQRSRSQKEPEDNRQKAYVTVGAPASRKSTIARLIRKKEPNLVQAELDQSRKALNRSPAHYGKDIVSHQDEVIKGAAQGKKPLIVSNTSIPKKHRESLSDTLRQHGYKPVSVLMPSSSKAAFRRNSKRPMSAAPGEGRVPDFVMNNMIRQTRGINVRPKGGGALSRKDRREARKNYKELHKKYRFTVPNMKRLYR